MLYNSNILTDRSQQLFLNKFIFWYNNSPKKISIFDAILWYFNVYSKVDPSQEKIADHALVDRTYANQILQEFHELGLILKEYRHRHTCIYKLNPIFYISSFRQILCKYLKNARWSARMLFSCKKENKLQLVETTPINIPLGNINKRGNRALTITSNCTVTSNVRNNKDTKVSGIVEPSNVVKEVCRIMKFNNNQLMKLAQYPDNIIKRAYERTFGKDLREPFPYFYKICSIEAGKNSIKGGSTYQEKKQSPRFNTINEKNNFDTTLIENNNRFKNRNLAVSDNVYIDSDNHKKPKAVKWPKPTLTKTYNENLNVFALWYEEHSDYYCQYYSWLPRVNKQNIKQEFIEQLDKLFADPEKIKRILERAQKFRDEFTPAEFIKTMIPVDNSK